MDGTLEDGTFDKNDAVVGTHDNLRTGWRSGEDEPFLLMVEVVGIGHIKRAVLDCYFNHGARRNELYRIKPYSLLLSTLISLLSRDCLQKGAPVIGITQLMQYPSSLGPNGF